MFNITCILWSEPVKHDDRILITSNVLRAEIRNNSEITNSKNGCPEFEEKKIVEMKTLSCSPNIICFNTVIFSLDVCSSHSSS